MRSSQVSLDSQYCLPENQLPHAILGPQPVRPNGSLVVVLASKVCDELFTSQMAECVLELHQLNK